MASDGVEDEGRCFNLDLDKFESGDEIPDQVVEIIDQNPFIVGGESSEELNAIESGLCICCSRPLGTDTIVSLGGDGIITIVCSGPCHDDLMIIGYLHEQLKDAIERVNMRLNLTDGHD